MPVGVAVVCEAIRYLAIISAVFLERSSSSITTCKRSIDQELSSELLYIIFIVRVEHLEISCAGSLGIHDSTIDEEESIYIGDIFIDIDISSLGMSLDRWYTTLDDEDGHTLWIFIVHVCIDIEVTSFDNDGTKTLDTYETKVM